MWVSMPEVASGSAALRQRSDQSIAGIGGLGADFPDSRYRVMIVRIAHTYREMAQVLTRG